MKARVVAVSRKRRPAPDHAVFGTVAVLGCGDIFADKARVSSAETGRSVQDGPPGVWAPADPGLLAPSDR